MKETEDSCKEPIGKDLESTVLKVGLVRFLLLSPQLVYN